MYVNNIDDIVTCFFSDKKLDVSSSKSAYKGILVKEMKELVEAFYTKMSTKIPLIKEMKKREIREMKEIVKDMKKNRKAGKQSSGNNSCSNPVYSSIKKPGDSTGRLVHYVSAKSILQQFKEWPSPCPSTLNKAYDTASVDSACPSMGSDDYAVSTSDVRYQEGYKK